VVVKLLNAVNDHPTSHIIATDNVKDDYFEKPVSTMMCS
jgi:hypothetical protein